MLCRQSSMCQSAFYFRKDSAQSGLEACRTAGLPSLSAQLLSCWLASAQFTAVRARVLHHVFYHVSSRASSRSRSRSRSKCALFSFLLSFLFVYVANYAALGRVWDGRTPRRATFHGTALHGTARIASTFIHTLILQSTIHHSFTLDPSRIVTRYSSPPFQPCIHRRRPRSIQRLLYKFKWIIFKQRVWIFHSFNDLFNDSFNEWMYVCMFSILNKLSDRSISTML